MTFPADDFVSFDHATKEIVLSHRAKELLELLPRIGAPDHHTETHIMLQDGAPFMVFSYAYIGQPFMYLMILLFPKISFAGVLGMLAKMVVPPKKKEHVFFPIFFQIVYGEWIGRFLRLSSYFYAPFESCKVEGRVRVV